MTKFKKIIPALCMLLISAVLMGTSTYAWFSMNTQVSATGMKVTANSDATYLVISDSTTLAANKTLNLNVSGTLLPVSYTTSEIKNAANAATLVEANKWFKAEGTSTSNGVAVEDSKTQLNINEASNKGTVDNKDYYVFKSFYIGLASGSSAVQTGKGIQADVTFSAKTSSNLNKALTVKIVYGDTDDPTAANTTQTYVYGAETGSVVKHASALQEDTLITTTATKVTVYIYFDGEDTNCTTANAINLDEIDVTIDFFVNIALKA